jgi:hypothetical protein
MVEVCSAKPQRDERSNATVMLAAIEAGDSKAAEQLLVLIYDELRRLAASKLAQEAPGQTLQPTALVHEASSKRAKRVKRSPREFRWRLTFRLNMTPRIWESHAWPGWWRGFRSTKPPHSSLPPRLPKATPALHS